MEEETTRPQSAAKAVSLTPARQRSIARWTLGTLGLLCAVLAVRVTLLEDEPPPRSVDFEAHRVGPVHERSVYWLGHSLMNARDEHIDNSVNLLDWVGELAHERGLAYTSFDHTLYGASLSVLWTGRALSYSREEPEMLRLRRELETNGDHYDALVFTEGIPLEASMRTERSAYYASRFYCAAVRQNPGVRVYLYESWNHLHASDRTIGYSPQDNYNFLGEQETARPLWEHIADVAATGRVPRVEIFPRLRRALGGPVQGACDPKAPIFLIPVATAMVALSHHLDEGTGWTYRGAALELKDLFLNPYAEWPEDWPREPPGPEEETARIVAELPLVHPGEDVDDIHPSDLGVYFATLVSFATLYRQTPVGLTAPPGLDQQTARGLQEFVWQVVLNEPRSGVAHPRQ